MTMTRDAVRARIVEIGIIPSVRPPSAEDARFAAETVARAGIPIIEVTMTTPNALGIIADLSRGMPDLIVGAGTIFDVNTARQCAEAGARFVSSPGLDLDIVKFAQSKGIVAVPGALTPTEVTAAWQAGSDFIKIFPCAQVGGASYIHALKGPFPDVLFVATGVHQQTAGDFIVAGAAAVSVGTELIPKKAVQHRDDHRITELARRFVSGIQEARGLTVGRHEGADHR
jgi:2-dehydro-3-deoxyphosphogluconate aldolase/(4S)-4-hydroxy-2-oxoglutarate aldolase